MRPSFGDEQVVGLHVAMDDAHVVRGGQTFRCLARELDGFRRGQGAALKPRAQRLALQQFADQVRRALVNADVVDGQDVRVVQLSRGARFLLEAVHTSGVAREGLGDQLDRNLAAETAVARAIDLPHAAGTEPSDDFVGADPVPTSHTFISPGRS